MATETFKHLFIIFNKMSIYWTICQTAGSLSPYIFIFEKVCNFTQPGRPSTFSRSCLPAAWIFRFFGPVGNLKGQTWTGVKWPQLILNTVFTGTLSPAGFSFHPQGHQILPTSSKRHRRRRGRGSSHEKAQVAPSAAGEGRWGSGLGCSSREIAAGFLRVQFGLWC